VRGRRTLALVAGLAALLLVAGACRQQEETPPEGEQTPEAPQFTTLEEGILTVGSDIPYPPFEFREEGELVGFDMDLINEIAGRLELETEIVDTDFDTIFSDLAAARFDVVIAASTITPEREEEVNFSEPYFNAQQSLAVNSGERSDIASTDDLGDGDVVAVQDGTTGEMWAEENLTGQGVEARAFPEGPDLYTALEAGQVDGAVNDEPSAIAEVSERPGLEIVQVIDTGEEYGIAVNPDNEELLEAVNQALAEIIEDGTYDEIYDRYPNCDDEPGGDCLAPSGRVTEAAA
jgi:ABC-type amino acid transport substrate-binding protein